MLNKIFISNLIIVLFLPVGCKSVKRPPDDKQIPAAQNYIDQIRQHRDEQDQLFKSADSPLSDSLKKQFTGIQYYPPDTNYRVLAEYEKIENGPVFKIAASGSRADHYKTVGKLHFSMNGKTQTLEVYENQEAKQRGNEFYFIPFFDLTNGSETYGGGRYIDVPNITGTQFVLDFNYAYQPYCAYNHDYSCPIPPAVNSLSAEVRAGEKM